jgi:para-nitrobenzyl esterase
LWPTFNPVSQRVMSLDEPRPAVETSFAADHHCGFWASIAAQL